MEYNEMPRSHNPRRKPKSKLQIFKEAYLPVIIIILTLVLAVVFIIGGINRRNDTPEADQRPTAPSGTGPTTPSSSGSTAVVAPELLAEAEELMQQAALLIPEYDYAGALAILDTFSGDIDAIPALSAVYAEYTAMLEEMVAWKGDQVQILSIHLLIADMERAFHDDIYANSYLKNFISTSEFSAILKQLYANGYMLVSLDDLYELQYDASSGREVYVAKTLLLPPGKTPVLLTETNANYYTYMTDSNNNGKPDGNADGFAYKLCYGENGFYNELIADDGTLVTGSFDMVPMLEDFIARYPDFSFRGARAIIAFSGYDGVLGYRIHSTKLTEAEKQAERAALVELVAKLRETGYETACFTYGSFQKGTLNYNELTALDIYADIQLWQENIVSIIGPTDIMVFPKEVDIAGEEIYDNSKFNVLYDAGFRFFLSANTTSWDQVHDKYVRHSVLMVTGSYLGKYPDRFADLFDAETVLDPYRDNLT